MTYTRKTLFSLAAVGMLFFLSACGQAGDFPEQPGTPTVVPSSSPTAGPSITPIETPIPEAVPATSTPTTAPISVPTTAPTAVSTVTPTAIPPVSPTPSLTKDDFNAADFFTDAVFAGDSVLSHFYWKVPFYDKETFGGSRFLVAVSYSAKEALKEESDIHPMYQGAQRPLWESIELIAPKRIFFFFGLNDIGPSGVEKFLENYKELIGKAAKAAPDAKLYILSITPMRADSEGTKLTNAKITEANDLLQTYCSENNIGFINIAPILMDEAGALNTEYSDGTNVHLTKEAYLLWKDVLVDYAKEQLLSEYYDSLSTTE